MGSYPQDLLFLEDHKFDCPECRMWIEVKESGMLNAEGTSEIWHEEQLPEPEEDKFAKWEEESGFKPACGTCGAQLIKDKCPSGCNDTSLLSNISREYDNRPQQPTEPHDSRN